MNMWNSEGPRKNRALKNSITKIKGMELSNPWPAKTSISFEDSVKTTDCIESWSHQAQNT